MILICLFIIMILLGCILMKNNISDGTYTTGGAFIISGSFFLIISVIIIIMTHAVADKEIQKNKIQYDGLCKRYKIVKSEYEDVSKSDAIEDITEWNIKVYNTKYWTENPWTNWFNPRKIADNLYYIPLDEEGEE